MIRGNEEEQEAIYDYSERNRKKGLKFLLAILPIIFFIIGIWSKISEYPYIYNMKYDKYFGNSLPGTQIIEMLEEIKKQNSSDDNYKIGIDSNYTNKDGKRIWTQNDYTKGLLEDHISQIDENRKYNVSIPEVNGSHYPNGYLARIMISDESKLNNIEMDTFNKQFEMYYGEKVLRSVVKELLTIIDQNNEREEEYKVRVYFDISANFTTNNKKLNMSTGLKTRVSEYSEEIKSDRYYFIDTYQTNPDGTIQTIVISSDNGKYR